MVCFIREELSQSNFGMALFLHFTIYDVGEKNPDPL